MSNAIHFVFIVTGTNKDPAPTMFSKMAAVRAKAWVTKLVDARLDADAQVPAGDIVRFVHFRCQDNAILVAELRLALKGTKQVTKLVWQDIDHFTASGDATFNPANIVVKPPAGKLLGMPHVYQSVRKAPDKSILELAVFSHAWVDGPVLQGGDDDAVPAPWAPGMPKRNDDDTNGRARTDFFPNMGEDPNGVGQNALEGFTKKFAGKATFIIFGCEGQDGPRVPKTVPDKSGGTFVAARPRIKATAGQVVNEAYIRPIKDDARGKNADELKKRLRKKSVPDDTDVDINMDHEFRDEVRDIHAPDPGHYNVVDLNDLKELHYGMDTNFFPDKLTGPTLFTTKWNKVLGMVARQMQETYAWKAAEALAPLGVTVLGGAPGTHATEDATGQMAVCGKQKKSECVDTYEFYETFMKLAGAKTGERRYFVFDTASMSHLSNLAKVK